jgi:protein-glutamine gamma-glutamyltransferase
VNGRRLPRPRKPGLPIAGTFMAVLLWGVVAHDSGAGWVQATGTLVAGFLVIGLVAPAIAVSRARCRVVSVAGGAVAGQAVAVELATSSAVELSHDGVRALSGADRHCRLEVVPGHRGLATDVVVTVASAAPFGFLWWERRLVLTLPAPLAVAPRISRPDALGGVQSDADRADVGDQVAAMEPRYEPRGVRPYAPGDRYHQVHWPATAHTGSMMVRETERPTDRPHTVTVELPDDPDAAERAAEQIMSTVADLLAIGDRVDMVTLEAGGPVRSPVGTVAEAGRRLARCLPIDSPWRP